MRCPFLFLFALCLIHHSIGDELHIGQYILNNHSIGNVLQIGQYVLNTTSHFPVLMNNSVIKRNSFPRLQQKPWATFPEQYLRPSSTSTVIPITKTTEAAANKAYLLSNCTDVSTVIIALWSLPPKLRKYGIFLFVIRTFVLPIFAFGDANVQVGPTEIFPKGIFQPPFDVAKLCFITLMVLVAAFGLCCCCCLTLRCC